MQGEVILIEDGFAFNSILGLQECSNLLNIIYITLYYLHMLLVYLLQGRLMKFSSRGGGCSYTNKQRLLLNIYRFPKKKGLQIAHQQKAKIIVSAYCIILRTF